MSTPVGKLIITSAGIAALAEAQAHGKLPVPKFFRLSEQNLLLDEALTENDITGWYTHDINLFHRVNKDVVEFVCDVPPNEATNYTYTVGLYFEDGTLFAVGKPPFPSVPMSRQRFKLQITYANAGILMNFQYIPYEEEEQNLIILDSILTQGEAMMKEMAYSRKITHIQGVPVQWIW